MQKLFFLPHPESDFIFSIVAEELGMIGALAVVAAFGVLAWRGLRAGAKAPDAFGRYLGWGLTGVLVMQALINVSVTIALLPTKGIPLPFISYGGSSLVVTLCICGVLLNVSQHADDGDDANGHEPTLPSTSSSPAAARAATSSRRSPWARSCGPGGGA